jgi:hypothetical protein
LRLLGFDGALGGRLLLKRTLLFDLGLFHPAGRESHFSSPHLLSISFVRSEMRGDFVIEVRWFSVQTLTKTFDLTNLIVTELENRRLLSHTPL